MPYGFNLVLPDFHVIESLLKLPYLCWSPWNSNHGNWNPLKCYDFPPATSWFMTPINYDISWRVYHILRFSDRKQPCQLWNTTLLENPLNPYCWWLNPVYIPINPLHPLKYFDLSGLLSLSPTAAVPAPARVRAAAAWVGGRRGAVCRGLKPWGVHKWGYPKMDVLEWNIWKWNGWYLRVPPFWKTSGFKKGHPKPWT